MLFNTQNKIIEDFAKDIAEEVGKKSMYNVSEITAIAATRLSFALSEIIKDKLGREIELRNKIMEQWGDPNTPMSLN